MHYLPRLSGRMAAVAPLGVGVRERLRSLEAVVRFTVGRCE